MKNKIIPALTTALLLASVPSYAVPIKIPAPDIADLSNYIHDPLFTAYFNPANTTIIDFEGPWSPPDNDSYLIEAVGDRYRAQGVLFEPSDTLMGGQPGFGYISPTTVVGGHFGYNPNSPIVITFVQPGTDTPTTVSAVGAFLLDGLTNESRARFYDLDGLLLGEVLADSSKDKEQRVFLGWKDTSRGIAKVVFDNTGWDDFYLDNLTFMRESAPPPRDNPVPEPGILSLFAMGLAWVLGLGRKVLA